MVPVFPQKAPRVAVTLPVGGVLPLLLATLITCFQPAHADRANPSDGADPYAGVNASWDRFGSVYGRVLENYFAPVDHEQIMLAAIEGLLRQLDPYSQYYDEEGLRQLRQDTTGRFAGLGITVGLMNDHPVVISPIEGTPASRAGLQPGDLIVAIEDRDTFGLSLEEVVAELRGEPGSPVRITIDRPGVMADWDVVIVREMITIRSVAVADLLQPGIGYISMRQTRFSEDTSAEVEAGLEQLVARGAESIIFDLRGNPGGLLNQATEVADLFLERGAPIVSVRERSGRREETKYSQRRPPAQQIPLVVLIDGGSASAAEIVAGAIQDNDRGVVVGTTSFGKGSVQTIFDLRDEDQAALKLTTALYYTPSGRSIHKKSLMAPRDPGLVLSFGDVRLPAALLLSLLSRAPDQDTAGEQLRARFELDPAAVRRVLATPLGELVGRSTRASAVAAEDSAQAYETGHGRPVFGGGGIDPDLVVAADEPPPYVQELHRHRVFFDFVVDYVGEELAATEAERLDVDEAMLAAFRDYLPRSAAAAARERATVSELDALRALSDEAGWNGEIRARIDSLETSIRAHADVVSVTDDMLPYLRAGLRRELSLRVDGRRASLLVDLDLDPQVTAAVQLLVDLPSYRALLDGHPSRAAAD